MVMPKNTSAGSVSRPRTTNRPESPSTSGEESSAVTAADATWMSNGFGFAQVSSRAFSRSSAGPSAEVCQSP
jgi:hypothetical protein